ncbi:hypothetical protein OSSY52_21090 [Tepiditoga spiralis]|uniref:Stage 0 sporulation protein A homolog n=1 Tax=Tepiditoga spiralis TaxID=2108365 RepID=A0A7G1G5Z3_9BACT|nr:HD domain-containing phosphohydrolase [Tepiditoga spiralis]BBE31968.1 hypothetical protein OSSY52_21090 [Tepiditoga spiralis]
MFSKRPICIVENDDNDFEHVKNELKKSSLSNEILRFKKTEEMLDFLKNEEIKPALILTALRFPGMNGIEFMKIAKKENLLDDIKVIVLTSADENLRLESKNEGFIGFIKKPFVLNVLYNLLRTFTSNKFLERNKVDDILKDISTTFNNKILKSLIAIKTNKVYTQLSFFDGYSNSIVLEYKGISFRLKNKIYDTLKNQKIFSDTFSINDVKNKFWWMISNLPKNAYIYIRKIEFENKDTGLILFITKEKMDSELNKKIDEKLYELSASMYTQKNDFEQKVYMGKAILNLAKTTTAYDPYIYLHSVRMADLSAILALLYGFDNERISFVKNCGMIHDLGNIFVSKRVLNKPGILTDSEFKEVQSHTSKLEELLSDNEFLNDYVEVAKLHHERLDGSGYYGLKMNDIPIESQILAIADIYDALTHDRPYRKAESIEKTLKILNSMAKDGKINKEIVKILENLVPIFEKTSYNLNLTSLLRNNKKIFIENPFKENSLIDGKIEKLTGGFAYIKLEEVPQLKIGNSITLYSNLDGIIEKFECKILNIKEDGFIVLVKTTEYESKIIKTMWAKKINLFKLESGIKRMDQIEISEYTLNARMSMFGANQLSFTTTENLFNLKDKLMIDFDAYGENIVIFGEIKRIESEENLVRYWVKYLNMTEDKIATINRTLFKRKLEILLYL